MAYVRASRTAVFAVLLSSAFLQLPLAQAFDVYWLPAGSSSWNGTANWADSPGGVPRGAVPTATFEEVGVINNGGTATLAAPIAAQTGGASLGQAATDSGTLTITSGGVFTSVASSSTSGAVAVGVAGTGALNVSGNGILTAPAFSVGGQPASQANFSGSAAVTISGASTIGRGLRITGPAVNFTSTSVTLQGGSVLTHEITSAAGHSPVRASGVVTLGGTLNVQFSGVTPVVGNTWNLVDATTIGGNFANAVSGGDINVTGAPTPAVGSAYRLRRANGGNGQLLQVGLESMLVLRVNRDTGELTIRNPQGAAVTQLTGYDAVSARGALLPTYKGISGAPAGNPGWEKAAMNSTTGLAEFKPSGVFNVSSSATSVSLGTGFSKTAGLNALGVAGLGVTNEDLVFEYATFGGTVARGQVEYVGSAFYNDMILSVTSAGMATLKNDTTMSLQIDGYSLVSSTGSLSGAGWTSLEDRLEGRFDGWLESPAQTSALSETNSNESNVLTIGPGESFALGDIGDFSTLAQQQSLQFKYLFRNENAFRLGQVKFIAPLSGDFDNDLDVDGNDFVVWQRGGSPNPVSPGDLALWKANFGATAATSAASVTGVAVPEPQSILLWAVGLFGLGCRKRRV